MARGLRGGESDTRRYGYVDHQCEYRSSAKAPANGTIDLAKFREPDAPKKREKENAASAACSRGFGAAAAGTSEESEEEEKERTRTAIAQAAESDPESDWDQVAQRFVVFLHPHWHLAPSGPTSALVAVGDTIFNPDTLHWEGNEQILRDFDAVVASPSRPAPRSSPTFPVEGPHSGERTALCDGSKGRGWHAVQPYRDMLGPPAGRCI